MPEDDRECDLAVRAAEGDAVALRVLLTTTRPRRRAYIARQVPADLARVVGCEDIVQEAHVEVFRRIGAFKPPGPDSFFRFTAALAVSLLRNAIKKHRAAKRGGGRRVIATRARSIEDSTIALLDMLAGPGRTPSRSVARSEAIDVVQTALADLPERYQQAVRLAHIEGRTAREAASQMGCTERAIHGLCRQGLKLLQRRLESASRFLSSSG